MVDLYQEHGTPPTLKCIIVNYEEQVRRTLSLTWIFSLRRVLTSKVLTRPIPESMKDELLYITCLLMWYSKLESCKRSNRVFQTNKSGKRLHDFNVKTTKLMLKLKSKSGNPLHDFNVETTKLTLKLKS